MHVGNLVAHRWAVALWHLLVLALLLRAFVVWRGDADIHWFWLVLVITPLMVLAATFAPLSPRLRSLVYWLLAAATVPLAAAGITGLIGWLCIVSIVLLIWAARAESDRVS